MGIVWFTDRNGEEIGVNTDFVVSVRPDSDDREKVVIRLKPKRSYRCDVDISVVKRAFLQVNQKGQEIDHVYYPPLNLQEEDAPIDYEISSGGRTIDYGTVLMNLKTEQDKDEHCPGLTMEDCFSVWIDECCDCTDEYAISSANELWSCYDRWAIKGGHESISQSKFGVMLRKLVGLGKRKINGLSHYEGIRLVEKA